MLDTATCGVKTECTAGRRGLTEFSSVQRVCWSRGGDYFIAGTRDGSLARWSIGESLPDWILPAHAGSVDAVVIAADDTLLVSQGRDGLVKFTNLLTLEPLGSAPWAGIALAVSSDGTQLAIDHVESPGVELLSCQAPASGETGSLPPSRDQSPSYAVRRNARVIAWPDGTKFSVSAGVDASTFDSNSVRKPVSTQAIGRLNDLVLDFPSGRWLRREEDKVFVIPPSLPLLPEPSETLLTRMADASFAYDSVSRRVLLGHRRGFSLYNFALPGEGALPKRESVKPLRLPGDRDVAVSAVTWSPDGNHFAWTGTDTRSVDEETKAPPAHAGRPVLHVCDAAAGGIVKFSAVLPAAPNAVVFVTGQNAVITADAATVACFDITGAGERWRVPHRRTAREPARVVAARAAPVLAVTIDPHTITLLDPATGGAQLTLTHSRELTIQAFDITPDGNRLLALSGNVVQLWRIDVLHHELAAHLNAGMTQ